MNMKVRKDGVAILMSTYNGAKYLSNQLYSLLQQTHQDWVLYIRDDGSTDGTIEIINKFMSLDSRIILVQDNDKNIGAGNSFWKLLHYSKDEYTIFCDQDDIWFERKLELMVAYANANFSHKTPALVYSNGFLYDDFGGCVNGNYMIHHHAKSLKDFLFMNCGYHGCCSLFNRSLLEKALTYKGYLYLHDDIVSLIAYNFGKVYYLPKQLMLYRQHSNNVTGKVKKDKFSLSFLYNATPVINTIHYEEKQHYFDFFQTQMSENDVRLFKNFFSYPHKSVLCRLLLVITNRFTLGGSMSILLFKSILRKPMKMNRL